MTRHKKIGKFWTLRHIPTAFNELKTSRHNQKIVEAVRHAPSIGKSKAHVVKALKASASPT